MPEYIFAGHTETTYPYSKDSASMPIGTVEPDDIRDLAAPLDHWWREVTDEDRARIAAVKAEEAAREAEAALAGVVAAEGAAPAPAVVPVPVAPPAPPAFAPRPVVIPPAAPLASTNQEG